jgi:hypothetical protein
MMMKNVVLQALTSVDRTTLAIGVVSLINAIVLLANVAFSRRLRRRHQALLRAEDRLSAGPVTASLRDRFADERTAAREFV